MRGTNKITKLKNLVVREVSFVNNPAIPDAKFVIVKEAEEATPTTERTSGVIEKAPIQSGTGSLENPGDPVASDEILDDGGRAELRAVVKQLIDKATGMSDDMQNLIAKIAKFHGIDPYTPEMLEAAEPKDPVVPAPVGGDETPSATKEAVDQPITIDQIRSLFAEMMEESKRTSQAELVSKSDPEPSPTETEIPEVTGVEGSDPEIDIISQAAEMLKKEEDERLQLQELNSLKANKEALDLSVGLLRAKAEELRRELLKARGKDPNESSVIA